MIRSCPCCGHEWEDEVMVEAPGSWAEFSSLWNAFAERMVEKGAPVPKVAKRNKRDADHLKARIKEDPAFMTLLVDAMSYMESDPFFAGANDRRWVPSAGYILQASKVQHLAAKHEAVRQAALHREKNNADAATAPSRFADRRRND